MLTVEFVVVEQRLQQKRAYLGHCGPCTHPFVTRGSNVGSNRDEYGRQGLRFVQPCGGCSTMRGPVQQPPTTLGHPVQGESILLPYRDNTIWINFAPCPTSQTKTGGGCTLRGRSETPPRHEHDKRDTTRTTSEAQPQQHRRHNYDGTYTRKAHMRLPTKHPKYLGASDDRTDNPRPFAHVDLHFVL